MVDISLRVLSRPDATKLPQILRQLGADYDERVLPSIVNETLKSVVAQFNASQLVTERDKVRRRRDSCCPSARRPDHVAHQVSRLIRTQLMARAKDFNIVLDDVSITDLSFSKEYTAAVEAKQVAQQEAQRAQFIVEKAKQDKKEAIVKADGEAQAARMIGMAVRDNPGFLQLRRVEAAREIAATIAASNNRVFLNADNLLLNVDQGSKK